MLEKLGLPTKPSLRGNSWVVDASHCQGCQSQFTFINRKHHCRRCGGLFCGKCTQKRMILRGQGDSLVRICESCKKIEEASRSEVRHGQKGRSGRGMSVTSQKCGDVVISQIKSSSSAVFSNSEGDGDRSAGVTPKELRIQASLEKGKYKVLKGEGNPGEAIKAFKRGKDLERRADALELSQRRNKRKAARDTCFLTDSHKGKADFADELRKLGWSDADVLLEDGKLRTASPESELSSLLGEISGTSEGGSIINRSQVTELKKRALLLKREGKREEAKEELKKAKVLERQLEELEILTGPEDSDEEITALMRSVGSGRENVPPGAPMELDESLVCAVDVTDEDLNDPEMSAVLLSFGWEEDAEQPGFSGEVRRPKPAFTEDKITLRKELLRLKKKALMLRREGKGEEAKEELRKCEIIEQKLEAFNGDSYQKTMGFPEAGEEEEGATEVTEEDLSDPSYLAILSTLGWGEDGDAVGIRADPRDGEAAISHQEVTREEETENFQLEILSHKWKAVLLKREGKLDEAKIELRTAKLLMAKSGAGECVDGSVNAEKPGVVSISDGGGPEDGDDGGKELSGRDRFRVLQESLRHKRQALKLRREGLVQEAEAELELAKALEVKLEGSGGGGRGGRGLESHGGGDGGLPPEMDGVDEVLDPQLLASLEEMVLGNGSGDSEERVRLEDEVRTEKMSAVRLKREGKREEALNAFRHAKLLEKRLKDIACREK